MASPLARLLEHRLLIVTGKGGVGKTSVATALARVAAGRGLDTVVVEMTDPPAVPPLLAAGQVETQREPQELAPHLFWLRIDPLDTLSQYLELQLPGGRLVSILGAGAFFREGRRELEFRAWLDELDHEVVDLPCGSFTGAEAFMQTGAATKLLVISREA